MSGQKTERGSKGQEKFDTAGKRRGEGKAKGIFRAHPEEIKKMIGQEKVVRQDYKAVY